MAAVELEQLLERHEAFWNGEGETALRRVTEHRPLSQSGGVPLAGGSRAEDGKLSTAESIDPSGFYRENSGPQDAVNGDFIVAAGPPHLCWTEAIMGCPVRVEIGGPWAEPTSGEWRDLKRLEADER
jgi:hypothetical protein